MPMTLAHPAGRPIRIPGDPHPSPLRLPACFSIAGRPCPPLILLFLFINGLVLLNALLHDPQVGYDAHHHLRYLSALASGRLVTPEDSSEFFSPPLPYLLPAAWMALTPVPLYWAAKSGQLLNVLLSLATTLYVLRICHLTDPNDRSLKLGALGFLAILPVYYKTFSYLRGEPYVAMFAAASAYHALRVFWQRPCKLSDALALGVGLAGAALSRQWGVLLVPGVVVAGLLAAWQVKAARRELIRALAISLASSFLICGWFYLVSHHRYGSITAFNREGARSFAWSNQPRDFYLGLGLPELFTDPVRGAFPNQLLPIFYSEIWGDYWSYFVVYARDTRSQRWIAGPGVARALEESVSSRGVVSNRLEIGAYLGRVNAVAALPSMLALAAVLAAGSALVGPFRQAEPDCEVRTRQLLFLLIVASYTGYLWFLVSYPNPGKGDTIKATYMLHTFPLIAVLVGCLLRRLERRFPALWLAAAASLAVALVHNLPVLLTRFGGIR